jgi:hypothetical protein
VEAVTEAGYEGFELGGLDLLFRRTLSDTFLLIQRRELLRDARPS